MNEWCGWSRSHFSIFVFAFDIDWKVQDILKGELCLLTVLFELLILNQLLALDLDFADAVETCGDQDHVNYQVDRDEVDQIGIFHQQVLVHVQQDVVQEYRDERIDSSNRVRWLLFSDVVRVRTVHSQSLDQFDVVHAANECVLAVADSTAEPEHADQRVDPRHKEEELAHIHEADAHLQIVLLHGLQLFVELLFLLHVSLFFSVELAVLASVGCLVVLFLLVLVQWLFCHLDFFVVNSFLTSLGCVGICCGDSLTCSVVHFLNVLRIIVVSRFFQN